MLKKIKIWLKARSYLYLLNAYTDAFLCNRLVKYSQRPEKQAIENQRIKQLVKALGDDKHKLLYAAYCQYYWNGWFDYNLGMLIKKFVKMDELFLEECIKELDIDDPYQEISRNWYSLINNLIFPLIALLFGRIANFGTFKKKFAVEFIELEKKSLLNTCIIVQQQNIKNNNKQIESLATAQTRKQVKINDYADRTEDKEYFLKIAAETLKMANLWDNIFIKLIKISLRINLL
jgi:hypothetical protein